MSTITLPDVIKRSLPMPVSIRILDSKPEASFEFESDVQEIYIGRNDRTCQVVLPADATRVSAEHCSLMRVPGGYRLRLNRGNVVLVDGETAHDDQDLGVLTELTLGRGGPRLLVETPSDQSLKPTQKQGERQASPHSEVRAVEARTYSRTRRTFGLGVALIGLVAIGGFAGFRIADNRAALAQSAAESVSTRVADLTVDVLAAREEERARFQPVVQEVRKSVYLVAMRLDQKGPGALQPFGTAWMAAPGTLATNAHVAAAFSSLRPGQTLVAVGPDGEEVRIRSVRLHPGFARFPEVVESHHVYDVAGGSLLSGNELPACDVALMDVDPQDTAKLGPVLPLASAEEFAKLEQGTALGFVGFPQEGLIKGGVSLRRPQATFQEGVVTGETGFFFERSESGLNQLVHFSMTAAGGASGSPVFTRDGHVVAILSAGNFAQVSNQARVPLGGVTYGQRIDLLRELLDGSDTQAILARHESAWNAELDKLFALGTDGLIVALERVMATSVPGELVQVADEAGKLEKSGIKHAVRIHMPTAEAGTYVAILVGERNVPIRLLLVRGKSVITSGRQGSYFSTAAFEATANDAIDALIVLDDTEPAEGVPFRVRVFRVKS